MQLQTTIDGYTVDLDTDMDGGAGGATTGCWINCRRAYETFSASLEALMAEGCLTSSAGRQWSVNQTTIDAIESWALENGY